MEIQAHREQYKKEFVDQEHGPLTAADTSFLDFFEPNPSYKVMAKIKLITGSEPFEIPTSSGKTKTYQAWAKATFKLNGKKHHLLLYRSLALVKNPLYADYLFLPFKDQTNGPLSYGGGRYLDIRMGEIHGKHLIIDFNKAYNPYCAFSAGYSCPIPPTQNHLNIAIPAGEKNFLGTYKGGH